METIELQKDKANKGVGVNLTLVLGIIGATYILCNVYDFHKKIDALSTILFTCGALLFIFYPIFRLIETVKLKGVMIGNWGVYRLCTAHCKASIVCVATVMILFVSAFIIQIRLL